MFIQVLRLLHITNMLVLYFLFNQYRAVCAQVLKKKMVLFFLQKYYYNIYLFYKLIKYNR